MKLAEALMERKDLSKKMERIQDEILNLVLVKRHVNMVNEVRVDEDNKSKVMILNHQLDEMARRVEDLNNKIAVANATHLIKEINALKRIDYMISLFTKERNKLLRKDDYSYGHDDQIAIPGLEVEDVRQLLETHEFERRKIDRQIQKKNWEVDI